MNWIVVECNLVLIIGIVVLASLETGNGNAFLLRAVVIFLLVILVFCLPLLNAWYINASEKMKIESKLCEYAKEYLYTKGMKENCSLDEKKDSEKKEPQKEIAELENEIVELKKIISETKKTKDENKNFYNFLLLKWAKENKAPFTKEKFVDIEKQFEEFQKSSLL